MTGARISSVTAQVVRSGSSGGGVLEAAHANMQVVRAGSSGGGVGVTNTAFQIVLSAHVRRVFVEQMTAQIIRAGGTGGVFEAAYANMQVIRAGDSGGAIQPSSADVEVVWSVGAPEAPRQRAWFFDFDGHSFYVLDLANRGALLYDIATGQWSHFETAGYDGHWNMKNGFHWRAGNMIVGGDIQSGVVYKLDPGSFFDDGWRPVVYEARGVLFATDIGVHRQYALRLMGSAGRTTDAVEPRLNMQFSDDQGQTWSKEYTVELTANTRQRIEFRSLGSFTHPGRIFRLYDTGGVKFIAAVIGDVEGEA